MRNILVLAVWQSLALALGAIVLQSRTLGLLSAAFMSLPILADADGAICDGGQVSVTAPSYPLVQSVCDSVERTLALLDQCDLQLSEPIAISIFDNLPNLSHNCFGFYECDSNRIWLRSPDSIANVVGQSPLYLGFEAKVVFDSIVAHEVAHAAFAQTACEDATCLANHEYVAYVVQMWSLPPSVRDEIVARFGQDEPVEPLRLNAMIAVMAPEKFAALAWQHFNEADHGCDFVQDLATGRTSLAIVWE
jgi:hypothetical protein